MFSAKPNRHRVWCLLVAMLVFNAELSSFVQGKDTQNSPLFDGKWIGETKRPAAMSMTAAAALDTPYKITLNLKQSNTGMLAGNILCCLDHSSSADIKEGQVRGNTISFQAISFLVCPGSPARFLYRYSGELKDGQLILTRQETTENLKGLLACDDTDAGRRQTRETNGLEHARRYVLTKTR